MKHQPKQTTILLSGGGTAGHIVPLLTLARELRRQRPDCRLVYIGRSGEKLSIDPKLFDSIYHIKSGKLRRWPINLVTVLLNIRDFFLVIVGVFQSLGIISKESPSIYFSKGSFVAVPTIIAARLRKLPIITHDSDAVAGLANRLARRSAVWHATGLPIELYDYPPTTCRYVGIPLDNAIFKPLTKTGTDKIKSNLGIAVSNKVLFVAGGSLGAASINQKISAIAPTLLQKHKNLTIVHVTGSKHLGEVESAYDPELISANRVKLFGYTDMWADLLGAADLVVSRGGGTVLAELAAMAKPSIIMASPYLASGHQLQNAKWYKSCGAIETIDDSSASEILLKKVDRLIGNPSRLEELSAAIAKTAKPAATVELAQLIFETVDSRDVQR